MMSKQTFKSLFCAFMLFFTCIIRANLIQHIDASESPISFEEDGTSIIVVSDLSGNNFSAVAGRGIVSYPSIRISESGLAGLDMGQTRNDLIALESEDAANFIDFSAENDQRGMSLIVAFTIDQLANTDQLILGTSHVGFHIKISSNDKIAIRLTNPTIEAGDYEVQAGETVVVAFTYQADNGAYSLWDSKNQKTIYGIEDSQIDFSGGRDLRLGEARTTANSNNYFRGMIGEFQLYDEVLSPSEMFYLQQDITEKWTGDRPEIPPVVKGPGFRNIDRPASDIGNVYFSNEPVDPIDMNARTVDMSFINGYLHMNTRRDSSGGLSIWDISDESNPARLFSVDARGQQHTNVMFKPSDDPFDTTYYYNQNSFFNVRDPLEMFSSTPPGFDIGRAGARGLSVLPYEYSGGSTIRITDARTGDEVSAVSAHGFTGTPTPLGNLLLVSGLRGQARGAAIYDISNPDNPELLDVMPPSRWENDGNPGYEYSVWKNYLILPNALRSSDVGVIDFADPTYLKQVSFIRGLPGPTRYAQFQDDYMFVGQGKFLMTPLDNGDDPEMVEVFSEQGSEYLLPLGNLIASAENTEQGRPYGLRIYAHQADADNNPPSVYYHSPAAGAQYQHVKSRIGILIHETLDLSTVNSETIRLFPTGVNDVDVKGTLNIHDKDIITLTPDEDFLPNTNYTVLLDGIADVSGNVMSPYQFQFTTSGPGDPPEVEINQITASNYPADIGSQVDFSAFATGGMGTLEYRWDFGDQSLRTGWQNQSSAQHTYQDAGHYTVKVHVRDQSGRFAKLKTVVVTVIDLAGLSATSPSSNNQIFVDEGNRRVWVTNPDANTVTVIHADTLNKLNEYHVCRDPRNIDQDMNGNMWVNCIDEDLIVLLNASSGQKENEIKFHFGARPSGLMMNSSRTHANVSLQGSAQIARIDVNSLQIDYLDTHEHPNALALSSNDSTLLVSRFISSQTQGEVSLIDVSQGMMLNRVIGLQKDTDSEDSGNQGRGLPNYLSHIAISPDNKFAYVAAKKDNIDRGEYRDAKPLTFETTVRSIVAKIDLSTEQEIFNDRIDIDNSSQPSAVIFSPYGDYLFVALQGSNEVAVYDSFSGILVTRFDTDLAPQSLAFDFSTLRLFVNNLNSRTVQAFDLENSMKYGFGEGVSVTSVTSVANELLPTSPTNNVLLGKQIFYNASDPRMSRNEYMSCASCHQDGGHDGQTWDFTDRGEGFRNTTNLRGRSGMAHGRVHWSANFDELQDFEIDIRTAFGGTGFITDINGRTLPVNDPLSDPNAGRSEELDALAAYISTFNSSSIEKSSFKNFDGSLTSDAREGQAVFNSLNCSSCHNPATDYTDSSSGVLHDVGTIKPSSGERLYEDLTGIDTPTLLGIHASAPYFHDGRAMTLHDLFDPANNPNRSGEIGGAHDLVSTGSLTQNELSALISFLLQLDAPDLIFKNGLE